MTQDALRTKWKCVVEFGDEETTRYREQSDKPKLAKNARDFLSLICSTIIRMDESS